MGETCSNKNSYTERGKMDRKNFDINLLGNSYYYTPQAEIEFYIDLFLSGEFGIDVAEKQDAGKTVLNAILKGYGSPTHKLTAFGLYQLKTGEYCVIIYNKGYCDFLGHDCLIVVLHTDIDLNNASPLKDIIEKAIDAEKSATYEIMDDKPHYIS